MSATNTLKRRRDERGIVLFMVVLMMVMIAGLSAGFLTEGLAEKRMLDVRKANLHALQICERGMIEASLEIYGLHDTSTDGIGTVSGDYEGGTFSVTASQHATLPDRWILSGEGTYRESTRRIEVGLRRRQNKDFVEGLYAKDELTFNGTTQTDAFDSRLGTWTSQAVNSDSSGTYAQGGGHVGSNKAITLNGSSVAIRGNAIPGLNSAVSLSGNPIVWGDVMPRRTNIDLDAPTQLSFELALATNNNAELIPPPPPPEEVKGKGKGGGGGSGPYDPDTYSLSATGSETVVLSGGTYYFNNVNLTGQAVLQVDGPTTIYVTGNFDVSGGGIVNATGLPSNLTIYAHPYAMADASPASSQVKIRGGAQAAMTVYAPEAALSFHGGTDVFGSFIGGTVTVAGGSKFHYDKALGDIEIYGKIILERLYWRDLDERLRY